MFRSPLSQGYNTGSRAIAESVCCRSRISLYCDATHNDVVPEGLQSIRFPDLETSIRVRCL
jgi:hypothetical protein